MKKYLSLIVILAVALHSCKSDKKTETEETTVETDSIVEEVPSLPETTSDIKITPISHATLVLEYDKTVIYVDPVGGAEAFEGMPKPKIVLVTDIHGDHFDLNTLKAINMPNMTIVVPKTVAAQVPDSLGLNLAVMSNGQDISLKNSMMDVAIEAIPMYNLREEALKFHEKGRGNGYILTLGGERVYISGDTEDIPEMRNLENIDIAFVCMNLPYTMTVESAASAVLDFKPKKVYPYHYRGTEGLSDVGKFKTLVNEGDSSIDVIQLDWYPKS
ncbi:MAG: MBL fold metallo-hydrolase [Mangrovimonas sp.]|nr:MBL fold metallo-hydrolase [Mangrovimonas sp.]